VAARQDAGLLELREHAVNGGQADVRALFQQHAEHVFGRHVALCALLEHVQDLQPRQRGLQAGALEFVDVGHGLPAGRPAGQPLQSFDHIAYGLPMSALSSRTACIWPGRLRGLGAAAAGRCNRSASRSITPYKVEVVQGNFVSKEQVEALSPA
jgi:hypothetical protein